MKHLLIPCCLLLMAACQSTDKDKSIVTFQVDMSEVIESIEDPGSIGLVGNGPLRRKFYTLDEVGNNQFEATIEFSLEDWKTIRYNYVHSEDIVESEELGVASRRTLTLKPGRHQLPIVKWGDVKVNIGRATPSPRLKVTQPDTEAEQKALAEPFLGITSDGQIRSGLFSIESTGIPTDNIEYAINNFLNSLNEDQRISCTFPIDAPEWRRWSNIDFYRRKGIGLPDLTEEQKSLAFEILKESLSPSGFEKTQSIMMMEGYLARLANDFEKLGSELYWFTFMGTPSDTEPWGWQIDGHHLIINYFILGDQVVMTPSFMGSEPTFIESGENSGLRTFEAEETLGLKFYTSLDPVQKDKATLHNLKEYNYIQVQSYNDNAVVPFEGLPVSGLNPEQKGMLENLIQEYIGNIKEEHANYRMREIMEHMDETWFAWIGDKEGLGPFYYRIHSPVVLIEFDHQKPVFLEGNKPTRKHIHTIVRTPNGNDYGKDLLRQHLEDHPH